MKHFTYGHQNPPKTFYAYYCLAVKEQINGIKMVSVVTKTFVKLKCSHLLSKPCHYFCKSAAEKHGFRFELNSRGTRH